MKSIKWTQTEKNLIKAFVLESQTRMRYDFYSKVAKEEWLEQIASIFEETALNEKEHAKIFLNFLEWWPVEIDSSYDIKRVWETKENLSIATKLEKEECSESYLKYSKIAKDEGFEEVAFAFEMVARVEEAHEDRFLKLLQNIENDKVFSADEIVVWKCRECWYLHEWESAPEKCPTCGFPKPYFERKVENY